MDKDNRIGFGGKKQLTEKVSASAEVSGGTSGFGAKALLNYAPTADDRYYIGNCPECNEEVSARTSKEIAEILEIHC